MTWQAYFLGLISAPASPNSVRVCDLWASSEGVLADNNPFACSGKYPGATHCIAQCGTSSEVWAYDTIEHGCEANAAFLGGSYYTAVVGAFRADAGEQALYDAINASPWCSGCQGGHYPVDLYDWLQNQHPQPTKGDLVGIVVSKDQQGQDVVYGVGKTGSVFEGHLIRYIPDTGQAIDVTTEGGASHPPLEP